VTALWRRSGEHVPAVRGSSICCSGPVRPTPRYRYQSTQPCRESVSASPLRISPPTAFLTRGEDVGVSVVTSTSKGLRWAQRPGDLRCVAFICLISLTALSSGRDRLAIRARRTNHPFQVLSTMCAGCARDYNQHRKCSRGVRPAWFQFRDSRSRW